MGNSIQLTDLSKAYSRKIIFNHLSYQFEKQVYHLIGENGTGKSTLLKLIMGLESADYGDIRINGECLPTNKIKNIFYAPDDLDIYPFLTGQEYLLWTTQYRTVDKLEINSVINQLELNNHLNTCISDMSFGTKKKFILASALVGKPDFLLLDEPFNGLDDKSCETLIDLLCKKRTSSGLIITSHIDTLVNKLHPIKLNIYSGKLIQDETQRACEV